MAEVKKKVINARIQNKYAAPQDWEIADIHDFKPLYGELIMHDKSIYDADGNVITPAEPVIYVGDGQSTVGTLVPLGQEASEKIQTLRNDLDNIELVASKIKFTKNLKFTKDFGYYTVDNGIVEIPTKDEDMTLQQLLDTAFAQDQNPEVHLPDVSITFSNTGSFEVGRTVSPQVAVSSKSLGSYEYGPITTGASWEKIETYIDSNLKNTATYIDNKTYNISSEQIQIADDTNLVIGTKVYYSGATNVPVTALGNDYAEGKFAAGSIEATASISSFRRMFFRTFNSITDVTVGTNIRPISINNTNAPKASATTIDLPIPAGTKQVCIALPNGRYLDTVIPTQGLQVDISASFNSTKGVAINGAAENTPAEYTIYTLVAADGLSENTYKIKIK